MGVLCRWGLALVRPLTLTLSGGERGQSSSLSRRERAGVRILSLSLRERAGVRTFPLSLRERAGEHPINRRA